MLEVALGEMPLQTDPGLDKLETKLTNVNTWQGDQLYGVGGEIPGLNSVSPKFYQLNIFHPSDGVIMCTRGC